MGIKDLGTLGGPNSCAEDINDNGQAVGAAQEPTGATHAFLYDGKTMIDLNALIDPASGWTLVGEGLLTIRDRSLGRNAAKVHGRTS